MRLCSKHIVFYGSYGIISVFTFFDSLLVDIFKTPNKFLQLMFRNRRHTVKVNKVALNRYDDNGVVQKMVAHGHYSLSRG